jgi:hypothetical protein
MRAWNVGPAGAQFDKRHKGSAATVKGSGVISSENSRCPRFRFRSAKLPGPSFG